MMDFTRSRKFKSVLTMPDLAEFMTTQEAAEKLGFHVKSIPKMVRDDVLKGVRFGQSGKIYNPIEGDESILTSCLCKS